MLLYWGLIFKFINLTQKKVMNRTFHSRTRWDQLLCSLILGGLCFYMVWIKQGILATLLAVLIIILIEKIIHTQYSITTQNKLIINRGRFTKKEIIDIDAITDIELRKSKKLTEFFLGNIVIITINKTKFLALSPIGPERFVETLIKRKENYIDDVEDDI